MLEGRPRSLPLGRLRITYTGGVAPLGSGRGDAPPTTVVVAAPMKPCGRTRRVSSRCPGRATSAARSPGSRRRRTPRTSSRWRTPRSAARGRRSSRNLAGQPLRGHRVERLLRRRRASCARRRWRRAAWPASPGRCWSSGATSCEVDEPLEVLATRRRGLPGLDDAGRAAGARAATGATSGRPGRSRAPPRRPGRGGRPRTSTLHDGAGPGLRRRRCKWRVGRWSAVSGVRACGLRRPRRRRSPRSRRRCRGACASAPGGDRGGHPLDERGDRPTVRACTSASPSGRAQLDDHDRVRVVVEARPHVDVAVAGGLVETADEQVATEGPADLAGDRHEGRGDRERVRGVVG